MATTEQENPRQAETWQDEGDREMAWAGIITGDFANYLLQDMHELEPCFTGTHEALVALRAADPHDHQASYAALGKAQDEVQKLRGAVAKHTARALMEAFRWRIDTEDVGNTAARCDANWRRYAG